MKNKPMPSLWETENLRAFADTLVTQGDYVTAEIILVDVHYMEHGQEWLDDSSIRGINR